MDENYFGSKRTLSSKTLSCKFLRFLLVFRKLKNVIKISTYRVPWYLLYFFFLMKTCDWPLVCFRPITTQWQKKPLARQDDRSGCFYFQDMHKSCIEGHPQTYQQVVNIKELIMTICNWTAMKTLAKSMHIGNGDNGSLNLNTTMAPKKMPIYKISSSLIRWWFFP